MADALSPALEALQQRLGLRFANPALLQRALTHRSHGADHYERLEFLGDAVLGLVVSTLLLERLPDLGEGELSRARASLVRQDALVRIAHELGLPPLLRLGEGEQRSGGRTRPSILADAVEALLGAIYLDAGFDVAQAVARRWYEQVELRPGLDKDPKTALQEWLQGRRRPLPQYEVAAVRGEAHAQTFEVRCQVAGSDFVAVGQGASRRAAEQAAAARMLAHLQRDGASARSTPVTT